MKTRIRFRKTTCLATILAFAMTFSLPDWAAAQMIPSTSSGRHASSAATQQPPSQMTSAQLPAASTQQSRLQIEHEPLACVTTVTAPVVEAKVQPGPDVSKSYVYWRAAGTPYFYYTVMEGPIPEVKGVIPRPLPETKAVDYYVQATDIASLSRKTPEYAPPVVQSKVCKDKGLAVGAGGAGLTIGLTEENQSPIPPGFNKADIAKVILLTGAVVGVAAVAATSGGTAAAGSAGAAAGTGAGAGAGAAGGGIGSTALIVGGAVVAAGVGIGVGVSSKNATPTPTRSPTPTPTPVANQFIEVDATWSGMGNIDVQLWNSSQQVGTRLPAGCESTSSRTERVLLTGSSVVQDSYQVRLVAQSCGQGTPAQIATVVTVTTDAGPKCQSAFFTVTVGSPPTAVCSFSVP